MPARNLGALALITVATLAARRILRSQARRSYWAGYLAAAQDFSPTIGR